MRRLLKNPHFMGAVVIAAATVVLAVATIVAALIKS